jgi:hypothetical protein
MVGRKAWTIVDDVACQTVVDSVQAMVERGRPWASMSVGVDNGKPWSVGVENRKTNVEVKSPMVERGRPRSAAIDHGRPLSATGDHGRPWSPEALSTKVSLVGVSGHADYRHWSAMVDHVLAFFATYFAQGRPRSAMVVVDRGRPILTTT